MKRPNILIIYTDQQRWDTTAANGNKEIITPNLDKLASQGLNFDHYFVQNPVCMPSRISFLTGMYPSELGITHMGVPVPEDMVTLPKILKGNGYTTANIGKLHFLPHANRDHREPHPSYSFDHLEISDEPGCYEDAYRAWVKRKAPDQLDYVSVGLPPAADKWYKMMNVKDGIVHPEERFPLEPLPFKGSSDVTHSAFVAEQTIDYIDSHGSQPWLCIAGFYSPHSPWIAPLEYIDLYDPEKLSIPSYPDAVNSRRAGKDDFSDRTLRLAKQGYYAMISEVDHHVGRIMDKLEQTGQSENTILIYTSDHGEWLGEHLKYGKSFPAPDCVSRVPFIVRWPAGIKQPGRTVSSLVEAVDMVPTVLEAAGIQVPPVLQGDSLVPLFTGGEYKGEEEAIMEGSGWKSIRTDSYRYIVTDNGKEQLYDLAADPGEYNDVSGSVDYGSTLAAMRKQLLGKVLRMERPLKRTWSY